MIYILQILFICINERISTNQNIDINNCIFTLLKNSNLNGGAISIIGNSIYQNILNCLFQECLANYGGSIYFDGGDSNIINSCFLSNNCHTFATSIYSYNTNNFKNNLNQCNLIKSGKISGGFGGWVLGIGITSIKFLNHSNCHGSSRESAGHYGWGVPIGETKYCLFEKCTGPYVFGPQGGLTYHSFCSFELSPWFWTYP